MTDAKPNTHECAFLIALVLLNLLGVLIMSYAGGWAFLPAILWCLIAPFILAKQRTAGSFGKCVFLHYGRFLIWGIGSLLLFMIGGALLLLGLEYLDGFLQRGP
ncbi:MAG: hypothetical protein IJ055_01455 [Oscillospiraceae bacterium]|nr:hypothetical protein [Oscillospiraceae bacterium]